jgi:TonB-dependent starch-binding outer membrane protein SusC
MKLKASFFAKNVLLLLFFAVTCNFAWAQRTITGTVTDAESGETLIGASVVVVGTTTGTVTDIDGKYSITAPAAATELRISYTGYDAMVAALGASNVVDAGLKTASVLDAVVVTGYGSLKSREVTSSVTSLKAEDFNPGVISNPAQLIQGKVAGLIVVPTSGNPNEPFQLRLRGVSTLSQSSTPLVVVDGIPGIDLESIDPADIASIDVLKDGSAAAIYGTSGSAGVILITTKSAKPGELTVSYNGNAGVNQISRKIPMMTAAEFRTVPGIADAGSSTDWLSVITRPNATNQSHSVSLGGGAGSGSYRMSVNYKDIQGTQLYTGYQQYGATAFIKQKALGDKLTVTGQLNLSSRNANFGFNEAFRYAMTYNPTAPSGIQTQPEYAKYGGYYQKANFDYFNPQAIVEQGSSTGRTNRLVGNVRVDYELFDGLSIGAAYSDANRSSTANEFYSKQNRFRGSDRNGLAVQGADTYRQQYYEATANYTTTIDKLAVKGLLGYNWIDHSYSGSYIEAGNFLTDATGADALGSSLDVKNGLATVANYRQADRIIGGFGRVNLNYDDTYFVEGSLRREGSSRFGDNNKFGWFPGVSAGVNLGKLVSIPNLSYLKLRAGYGVTGQNIGQNYLSQQRIGAGASFYYNGSYVPSYGPVGTNANPDLKWENKGELNIGIEARGFGDRVSAILEYYNRNTTNLLKSTEVPVPPNLVSQTWKNVGTLNSSGIEAMIEVVPVKTAALEWKSSFVFATYNIVLTALSESTGALYQGNVGAPGQNNYQYTRVLQGEKIGNFFGPVAKGTAGGKILYDNGAGGTTDDITKVPLSANQVIGNGLPKGDISWNNMIKIGGGIDLGFNMQSIFGHNKVNEYRVFYEAGDNTGWNQIKTKYYDPTLKAASAWSSRYVEDGTFLKIGNISAGYTLPIAKGSAFSKVRIGVAAIDPIYFTNYTGVNPNPTFEDKGALDQGSRLDPLAVNPLVPGVDRRYVYFLNRSFNVNLSASF